MDNTLKLRVILLCFVFAVFGYGIGNFNTLKARFCYVEPVHIGSVESNDSETSVYVVKNGDTLESIAKIFNVSVEEIIKENSIQAKNISTGQNLLITGN